MKALDTDLVRERSGVLERHLERIEATLPKEPLSFELRTDVAEVVSLHLLFGIQVVLDLAVFACIHFRLQAPASYDDAVARLAHAGRIADTLADRLEKAANFRDALVHAFDDIDAETVHLPPDVWHTIPHDLTRVVDPV